MKRRDVIAERILKGAGRLLTRRVSPWVAQSTAVHPELHPEMRVVVGLSNLLGEGLFRTSPRHARALMRRSIRISAGHTEVARVEQLEIPGADGQPQPARHYVSVPHAKNRPLLVYLHGGGYCLGDLSTHDEVCRVLSAVGGFDVLAVTYRLAPEHVFPAALDDCRAALAWAHAHAAELGCDPSRIAVGGDSAGGNLSAVLCVLARDAGGPMPALQLLLYPKIDSTHTWPSVVAYGQRLILTREDMDRFTHSYLQGTADLADPRVSPLRAPSHAGLPPAIVVTAGCDPLRDEGDAYARVLTEAGVRVQHMPMPGMVHGFLHLNGTSPEASRNLKKIARTTAHEFARLARKAPSPEKVCA